MYKYVVFIDFDNTITTRDVLDGMLERYSTDERWLDLEDKWKRGKIGSKECLDGQVRGIRVTRKELDKYMARIRIDPYFKRLLNLYSSRKIKPVILSDNFDYILNGVLKNNGITGLRIFSNRLKISGSKLTPSFTFTNDKCGKCAHCKRDSLVRNSREGYKSVYIGDGLSDVDAAKEADIVFAKDYLRKYFKRNKIAHIPYDNMKDVYEYFKRRLS